MRKTAVFCCFGILIGILESHPVTAKTPVPEVKPLSNSGKSPFLEGVDLPRSKPKITRKNEQPEHEKQTAHSVCEIPGAIFESVQAVDGQRDGDADCGFSNAISLTAIQSEGGEMKFPAPILITCEFATVLTEWLRKDVLPAARRQFGDRLHAVGTGPGYQCRRRNNLPDGKLSEHAMGKAVDISGFRLEDGTQISIEKDWAAETASGRFLKEIHAAACKRFTTVLGPDVDPNHKSHFHLDIGCHGKTCTYLICQ